MVVLVAPSHLGTVVGTLDAATMCCAMLWSTVVSHRPGETQDPPTSTQPSRSKTSSSRPAPPLGRRVFKHYEFLQT